MPASREDALPRLPRQSRFTFLCNGPRSSAAGARNGHFFGAHRQAPTVCKEREGSGLGSQRLVGTWTVLPSWDLFPLGQLTQPSRVQRGRGPCVHLLCASSCCAPGRRNVTPGSSCSPEGEDTKLMTMTLGVTVRFGEHRISVRRRART